VSAAVGPRRLLATDVVGRDDVLARLEDALDVTERAGTALELVGEAGLGKTRLARACIERARTRRRHVLEGRARHPDAGLTLGIFQDALRADRRTRERAREPRDPASSFPARLLPELGAHPEDLPAERAALFEAACSYLRALAGAGKGLVVVLEDLHWADPSSHALLAHLAQATRADPLLLLLTYRPDEMAADSSLAELRRELARERLADEIVLGPLDEDAVGRMLDGILGVPADDAARAAACRMSGGNPFAVEEFVRDAVDAGRLDPESGQWNVAGPLRLPRSVQEMLLTRVRRLAVDDQELLRWAAVVGERLDLRLLAAASGRDEGWTLSALARLHEAGLVVEDASEPSGLRFTFRHALTREAVLAQLLTAERRRRHARVLEAAEALYSDAPDAPLEELASHALAAGDRVRGFTYFARAARRSLELCGYAEADAHFERALELWEPAFGQASRAALLLEHGRLLARVDRRPRALEVLRAARDAALAAGERAEAAVALAAAAEARFNAGERAGVLAELRAARAELRPEDPPAAHLDVLPVLAWALRRAGDYPGAVAAAREGLALVGDAPGRGERLDQIGLMTSLGSALWLLGDSLAGETALVEAVQLAREHGDDLGAIRALWELSMFHLSRRAADAARHADEAIAIARRRGVALSRCWCALARALVHAKAGEPEAAESLLDAAERDYRSLGADDPCLRLSLVISRGEWHLAVGAIAEAAALTAAAPEATVLGDSQIVAQVGLVLARARLADGDPSGARAALLPAIAAWGAASAEPPPTPPSLLLAGVEIAALAGDAAEAERLAGEVGRRVRGPRADYARALADAVSWMCAERPGRAPGTLAAEAVELAATAMEHDGWRFEGARMRMVAAEALAPDDGARGEAADLAAAALLAFRAMAIDGWRRRAEGLLRRLGRRAPTRGLGPGREGLTARELEVLGLVADGHSNRSIAARLVISEATVARHVANLFAKLAVHSRAQAARVAAERGLLEQRR